MVAGLALAGWALLTCSDSGDNAADISDDLADRLTDALDFEDGEVSEHPPPEEHANNSDFPQVTLQNIPTSVAFNTPFSIVLTTTYDQPLRVRGAVVHPLGARRHIVVTKSLQAIGGIMTLNARLLGIDDLYDKEITLQIALFNDDGDVGNYVDWTFATPRWTSGDVWWRCDPDDPGSWHKYIENSTLRECLAWCAEDEDVLCTFRAETGLCACSWDRDRTGEL